MACRHKFYDYLNLERLDFEPTTLIVGTFNPEWPANNQAEWFYGRTRNNYFWDVLPRLYDHNLNLRNQPNVANWKQFCHDNQLALTDMICSIDDADENNIQHINILGSYLDSSIANYFNNFTFTNLIELLDNHLSIRNIYLTRLPGVELFDNQWELVRQYCNEHAERNLHVRNLITPSASARFQIKEYRNTFPQDQTPLRNFIYKSWLELWRF